MSTNSEVLSLIEKCRELQQLHEAKNRTYPLQLEIANWRDNEREFDGSSSQDDE
jgi:hypothetical protein